jgi:hypothetical protein
MLGVVLKLSPEGVTCAMRAARGNTEKSGNSGVALLWSKAVQMFDALTITESERMIKAVNVLIDKLLIQQVEWQAHPKVAELRQSMEAYITSCNAFYGERQRLLLEKYPELIINAAMSINCISSLPEEEAIAVATQRELFNVKMRSPPLHVNKAALGCETSAMKSMKEASQPGSQLSVVMSTPIVTDANRVVTAMVISVPAPALDIHMQPEWSHYVENGKLKEKEYSAAMGTLKGHVLTAAAMYDIQTLALSAYGLNNFLNGFRDDRSQKEICIRIGQGELSELITNLQEKDCDVRYMEREAGENPLWNSLVKDHPKLSFAGTISGDWIGLYGKTMIVNAWDGHALVGNACNKDDSIDGYLGRASGAHIAHALFINGSLLKTEMKVESIFADKEFHQRRQFGRQGLGEAGTPAAREPVQRCQPGSHRAQQAWPAAAHWQAYGLAFFSASGGYPDCAVAPAGLPATSRRQRHSTPAPNDGESPGHCAP